MIVTLLTDFGTQDEYVGVIKGVILGIHPAINLVDLCHHIPPQDIEAAGYLLRSAYGYFPEGTLHMAVVDPGVGTDRSIIAARCAGQLFMAPDNGLLPLVWGAQIPEAIVRVENEALFRHPVSRTFHGRDVFAPVAAYLAGGNDLEKAGPQIHLAALRQLDISPGGVDASGDVVGRVIRIDQFGNLITNIEMAQLDAWLGSAAATRMKIHVGGHCIAGLSATYADGDTRQPLALVGSHNCIEIAMAGGHAANAMGVGNGAKVRIQLKKTEA